MCLKDLLDELRRSGVTVSESQVRWAIRSGQVSRPRIDGSLRFDFDEANVAELCEHFGAKQPEAAATG